MDFNSAVNHGVWFAYMAVFAGGLLTALTPCVFPLIPITVSIFGARQAVTKSESALLSGLYVAGIAVMYTALGLLAASTGRAFGSVMGNRWIISAVAALFIVFALAMLGLFDLAPGAGLLTRLSRVGGEGRLGAFAMGIVAGVIAAPCTGPILAAVRQVLLGSISRPRRSRCQHLPAPRFHRHFETDFRDVAGIDSRTYRLCLETHPF